MVREAEVLTRRKHTIEALRILFPLDYGFHFLEFSGQLNSVLENSKFTIITPRKLHISSVIFCSLPKPFMDSVFSRDFFGQLNSCSAEIHDNYTAENTLM